MVIVVYKAGKEDGGIKDSRNDLLEVSSPYDVKPAPVVVTRKIQQRPITNAKRIEFGNLSGGGQIGGKNGS
jgi:hypothetical protein